MDKFKLITSTIASVALVTTVLLLLINSYEMWAMIPIIYLM